MFGDLIPLPIDSSCPQFTSPKVGQEQGATTERQAASHGSALSRCQTDWQHIRWHTRTEGHMDRWCISLYCIWYCIHIHVTSLHTDLPRCQPEDHLRLTKTSTYCLPSLPQCFSLIHWKGSAPHWCVQSFSPDYDNFLWVCSSLTEDNTLSLVWQVGLSISCEHKSIISLNRSPICCFFLAICKLYYGPAQGQKSGKENSLNGSVLVTNVFESMDDQVWQLQWIQSMLAHLKSSFFANGIYCFKKIRKST